MQQSRKGGQLAPSQQFEEMHTGVMFNLEVSPAKTSKDSPEWAGNQAGNPESPISEFGKQAPRSRGRGRGARPKKTIAQILAEKNQLQSKMNDKSGKND